MSKALQTLMKGSAISFVAMLLLGITNYLIRRTLALNLSEIEYGFFYAAFSFCMLFLSYLDLGLGQSAVILMSKYCAKELYDKVNGIFSLIIILKILGGLLIAIPLVIVTPYLAVNYFKYPQGEGAFYFFCMLIPVTAVAGTINAAYDAKKDFLTKNILNVIQYIIIVILLLVFIRQGKLVLAAFAFLVSPAIIFLAGMLNLSKVHSVKLRIKGIYKNNFKETFHLSKWVALSVAGLSTMSHMDTQMLVWYKGLDSVALYNIALPIMQIMNSFMFLPQVFMPIAADLWHSGDHDELKRICSIFINTAGIAGGLIVITLICTRDVLIIYLFDEKYLGAQYALIILCTGVGVFVVAQFLMNTLNATGKQKQVSVNILIGVAVNIAANAVLIPIWGISGAAIATCLSYLVISILSFLLLRSSVGINVNIRKLSMLFALTLVAAISAWYMKIEVGHTLINSVLLCFCIVLIYCFVVLLLMKEERKVLIKMIGARIKSGRGGGSDE